MKLSSMGAMICWVPVLHSRHRSIQGEQSHSRDGSALPFFDGGPLQLPIRCRGTTKPPMAGSGGGFVCPQIGVDGR